MIQKVKKPDTREYTLMVVPHHGKSVVKVTVPIQQIKAAAIALGIVFAVMVGSYCSTYFSYRQVTDVASAERSELEQLRSVNVRQAQQIENLAQATAVLQDDMTKLNQLDGELRRLVNNEDPATVSRSGVNRPAATANGGQGGPTIKPQIQELDGLVRDLQAAAKERQQSLAGLKETLLAQKARQAVTPSIWPAAGEVTSRFGWRTSPWGGGGGDWHPGIDIAGDYGTPIYAAADGYIRNSSWNGGGYGNLVEIDHGNGIVTLYGHNAQNVAVNGSQVKKGDLIAYMGSTGASTGTHLHYEVRVNGSAVNPASFLH
ncbi:MAG TPA: M23 family metallopeptidase [Patescibacteria group bacterium]|nr:M23 family metallopeptidase [Patescibacteria group bacterium]